MLKLLLMVAVVIIGILGYKEYRDKPHNLSSEIEVKAFNTMNKVERDKNEGIDSESMLYKHIIHSDDKIQQTINKVMEIGETLQDRSYEEIENDTLLSNKEKEFLHMERVSYDDIQNVMSPSTPLSEVEIEKMMINEIAQMKEFENERK